MLTLFFWWDCEQLAKARLLRLKYCSVSYVSTFFKVMLASIGPFCLQLPFVFSELMGAFVTFSVQKLGLCFAWFVFLLACLVLG